MCVCVCRERGKTNCKLSLYQDELFRNVGPIHDMVCHLLASLCLPNDIRSCDHIFHRWRLWRDQHEKQRKMTLVSRNLEFKNLLTKRNTSMSMRWSHSTNNFKPTNVSELPEVKGLQLQIEVYDFKQPSYYGRSSEKEKRTKVLKRSVQHTCVCVGGNYLFNYVFTLHLSAKSHCSRCFFQPSPTS